MLADVVAVLIAAASGELGVLYVELVAVVIFVFRAVKFAWAAAIADPTVGSVLQKDQKERLSRQTSLMLAKDLMHSLKALEDTNT